MLYKIVEDYNDLIFSYDNVVENDTIDNECFICFEIKKEDEKIPLRLKSQTIFFKFCDCDGWVHNKCLYLWFNVNNKCPICRNVMIKNYCFEMEYGLYIIYYFYTLKALASKFSVIITRMRNIFILCAIFFNICNITSSIMKHYHNSEENTPNYIYDYTIEYIEEPTENRIIPHSKYYG